MMEDQNTFPCLSTQIEENKKREVNILTDREPDKRDVDVAQTVPL